MKKRFIFMILITLVLTTVSGCRKTPVSTKPLSEFSDDIIKSIDVFSSKGVSNREEKLVITYSTKTELVLTAAFLAQDDREQRYNRPDKNNHIGSEARIYFEKYKEHKAVKKLQAMRKRGFWYDALTTFAMCYSDPPNMEKVFPYPKTLLSHFFGINKEKELKDLAEALNEFYKDTKFDEFLNEHKSEYDSMIQRIKEDLKEREIVRHLEDYYGDERKGYFMVVSPLMLGGHAGDILYKGDKYNFNICGPGHTMDGKQIEGLAYHEFGHSFVNIEAEKNKELVKKYEKLQVAIEKDMKSQSYPKWEIALNEHVLRATNARMYESLDGTGMKNVKQELSRGFKYVPGLYKKLEEYDKNRDKYKKFSDFYPELIKSLDVYISDDIPDELNITTGPVINDLFKKEFLIVYGTSGDSKAAETTRQLAEKEIKYYLKIFFKVYACFLVGFFTC